MNRKWQLLVPLSMALVTSSPGALIFTNIPTGFASTLNAVVGDNQSSFFAVGQNTLGLGATFNLTAWTTSPVVTNAPADGALSAITYGGGQFVAGGVNGSTFFSADRTNWIRGAKANSLQATVSALTYNGGAGRFAAVALFPLASWSADVSTAWTAGALAAPVSPFFSYHGLTAFGANSFIACGDAGTLRRSTDGGANWAELNPNVGSDTSLRAVASDGAQQLVAVGSSGRVLYSLNGGNTWQTNAWIAAGFGGVNLNAVAFMDPGFIVAADGGRVFTIADITTTNWTVNTPTAANLLGVAFGTGGAVQGLTVLVGGSGTVVIGGTPPASPTPGVDNTAKCAFEPAVTNSVNIVNDALHPAGAVTIVWRDASGNLVPNNSATANEFVLVTDVPGTYTNFAKAKDLRTGIESEGPGTPVVTTVNPLPPPPVNTTLAATNCAGAGNSPLTVSVTDGVTADWFDDQGVLQATGVLSHIPTNTAAGTYTNFARARFLATGCYNTNLTPVAFTINPLPTPPVNTTLAATNCAGSANSPLTVSVSAGVQVDWFNAQGVFLDTGALYVPTNTVPGTYTNFAQARFLDTGCINPARTPVVFVINPLPAILSLSGTQTNCYGIANQVTATLGGSAGPWNVVWSDGTNQAGVTSPVTRTLTPAVGTTVLSITALNDATTLCSAAATNLSAFSVTLKVEDCSTTPLTIRRDGATNVVVEWYGNLRLLRTPDLTPPITWSLVTTGTPGSISRWTNSIVPPPPNNFFRLTNAP